MIFLEGKISNPFFESHSPIGPKLFSSTEISDSFVMVVCEEFSYLKVLQIFFELLLKIGQIPLIGMDLMLLIVFLHLDIDH